MVANAFYWLVTYVVKFSIMPLYATIDVRGVENVPSHGPLIVASNHLNDVDPGVLCTRIPRRLIFMTKIELFRVPVLGAFLRAYGAFPVRRGEADLSSLRRSNETLRAGLALVLFPEGTRAAMRANLGKAWPGAGLLALRHGAPVLPCAITGSQDMAMPGMFLRVFRRRRITLTIGRPFELEKPQRLNTDAAVSASDSIMRRIAELLPPEYRGYYGDGAPAAAGAADSRAVEE